MPSLWNDKELNHLNIMLLVTDELFETPPLVVSQFDTELDLGC